jgi:hypothetical protein
LIKGGIICNFFILLLKEVRRPCDQKQLGLGRRDTRLQGKLQNDTQRNGSERDDDLQNDSINKKHNDIDPHDNNDNWQNHDVRTTAITE